MTITSIKYFFDKYVNKKTKTTTKEFAEKRTRKLHWIEKNKEEALADFNTWSRKPSWKSPSPFEKH